jgi:hypothetical protein
MSLEYRVPLILLCVCIVQKEITIHEYYLISQVSTIVMGQMLERENLTFRSN